MAHRLLPSQTNDVLRTIQLAELDPNEFYWREVIGNFSTEPVPAIVHAPTRYFFMFDWDRQHVASYSPGGDSPTETFRTTSWENQLGAVGKWLLYLAREYHAPDLWGELEKQRKLAAATAEPNDAEEDRPFLVEEQALVARQLDEIKELLIRNEQLDTEGQRRLEAGIEHLKDASRRMGRREWLTIFYGTVFSWALSGLVSPDNVRQAITLAAHGLAHLFGVPPAQLMP